MVSTWFQSTRASASPSTPGHLPETDYAEAVPDPRKRVVEILQEAVRAALSGRLRLTAGLGAELAEVRAQADSATLDASAMERRWAALASGLSLQRRPFEASMTVDEAWRRHPGVREVFAARGLPGCDACAVRFDETLEEVCSAYGLDLDELLSALGDLLLS